MADLVIYSDGACAGNPGPGGWGVRMEWSEEVREFCGGAADTTNNRMELTAAIEALMRLPEDLPSEAQILVCTDSRYVMDGLTQWLPRWKARRWRTAANKPVKNADLWQRLEALAAPRQLTWQWVRGHTGHVGNERADALARQGMANLLAQVA